MFEQMSTELHGEEIAHLDVTDNTCKNRIDIGSTILESTTTTTTEICYYKKQQIESLFKDFHKAYSLYFLHSIKNRKTICMEMEKSRLNLKNILC